MNILTLAAACLCLPTYIPLFLNSVRQLQRGEVILTRWSFLNLQVTRLTGGAALLYSGAQLVGNGVIILGILNAVNTGRLGDVFISIFIGWLIGLTGATVARNMQDGVSEVNIGADNIDGQVGGVHSRTTIYTDGEHVYTSTTETDFRTGERRRVATKDGNVVDQDQPRILNAPETSQSPRYEQPTTNQSSDDDDDSQISDAEFRDVNARNVSSADDEGDDEK